MLQKKGEAADAQVAALQLMQQKAEAAEQERQTLVEQEREERGVARLAALAHVLRAEHAVCIHIEGLEQRSGAPLRSSALPEHDECLLRRLVCCNVARRHCACRGGDPCRSR